MKNHTTNETTSKHANLPQHSNNETSTVGATSLPSSSLTLSDHNNPNTNVTKTTTTTTEHVISNPQHTISSSNITHGTSNSSNVVPPKRELSHRLLPLPTPPSQKQQQQPHSSHPSHQVVTSSSTSFHFSSDDENTNPTITKSDSEDKYKKTDHEMRKVQSARNSSAGTLLNSLIHPTHATTLGEQNNSKKENQLQNKASSSASTSSKFEQHQNPIGSAVATGVHKSIKNLGEALHAYHFEIVKVENIGKKLLHLRNHHHNKNNSNTDHHHTMTNNSNTLTTTVSTTNHTVVGTSENVNNISTENNVSTTTTTTATNSPRGTNTETISIKIEPHNEQQSCTVPVVSSPSQQQVSSSSTNNNNSSTTAALTSTNSTTKESPPQPALSPHSPPTLTSPSPRTMRKHSSMRDDIVSAFVKGPHSEDFDLAQFSSIVNNDSISQQALTTSSASTPRSLPSSSNSFLPSHQHHEIKYSLLMTKSESLCMDCKNINCKCVLISVPTSCIPGQEQDEQNTMVAFEMVGTVLLTTSRILFLIDEDSAVEASSPESQNLQKIIEILLSNVEYIEKNTEKERSMCIVEKSPMNPREGDMDPPPIKFIKKYEFFGFESHTTFQRAFKTFNDMLNVIRTMESETTLEGTTSVETNNLSNDGGNRKATPSSNTFNDASEKKLSVTTSKRERYTRKRVSVANTFHDLPSNYSIGSNVRKFLSPLEEALTNNFSMVDRKLLTPPSKKTVALAETKHRRSLSLSSPVVYEAGASKAGTTSSNKPGGSSISESGDDDKRTVISEGAVSIGGGAESSADEAESKRRSKKREKRQSLAIPTLVVDPPSQEFDDQFDGMVDEVAHFADDVPSIEPNDIFAVADQKSSQVKMKEVVSKKFMGISAEELFQACFSNASTFLVKVHEKLGDTGVELYDWVDFQYGAPTVRGITYKIGGSSPNHFSSFTQTAIRVLETQRVVLAKNTSKDKPMSYFILFTSAATQDMANNQMFQFDVKYIVKDTKPLNLLMNKECEIEICAGTQCKGGSIFWRSKSTESSVMKAIKNRLMVELDLMNETVEAIVNAKKNALSEQRLKSWEASVMSTISSLDGGFPKEMPSLNNLLPPPLCVESSPPPSPRDGDGDMSESLATNEDEDELTCGSTTSAVPNTPHSEFSGGENESSSQRRVKVVGFSSTSHLTVLPPPRISVASPSTPTLFPPGSNNEGSNLVRVRKTSLLDTSPTFANNFVVPTTSEAQHTVEGEAKQSNEITCIDSSVTNGTSSNMEMHSSLTITDMRPDQIKQLDPILLLLWELLISMCKSIFNVLSTVFEYAVNYFLEPVLTFSWNFKDIVSGVIIVFLILVFMYGNHSITNRVNNLAMETGQIHKELKNKFILARNMVHRIQDSSHMNSTQLQSSLRDIMKDYLVEHRKLSRKVEQHDLMKSLRDFRAKLKENVKR
ncbi:hypothetical protein C9374_008269 [Naegleria lovaniensis]|uniref:VASt domain-containing protein n=1 Tax=Naegleria lovaniensis TaxID=51637 RepID=A0AA88GK84_NAELO|nr:uncharacterized protein C9374_008269 [Naegleria lovaniensis]KAG2378630.1 hypothetical protein C9374_008269 [Naegleria lovaniensis]